MKYLCVSHILCHLHSFIFLLLLIYVQKFSCCPSHPSPNSIPCELWLSLCNPWMLGWSLCIPPSHLSLLLPPLPFLFKPDFCQKHLVHPCRIPFLFIQLPSSQDWIVLQLGESYYQKQMWPKEERFPHHAVLKALPYFANTLEVGPKYWSAQANQTLSRSSHPLLFFGEYCSYFILTKGFRFPHSHLDIMASEKIWDLLTSIFKVQKLMLAHVYTQTSLKHLFLDYDIWTVHWNVLSSFIWQMIITIYINLQNILWSRTTSMEFSVLDSPFFQPVPAKIGIPLSWQVAPLFPCQFLTAGKSLVLEKSLTIINYTAALPQALHRKWEWTSWIY